PSSHASRVRSQEFCNRHLVQTSKPNLAYLAGASFRLRPRCSAQCRVDWYWAAVAQEQVTAVDSLGLEHKLVELLAARLVKVVFARVYELVERALADRLGLVAARPGASGTSAFAFAIALVPTGGPDCENERRPK